MKFSKSLNSPLPKKKKFFTHYLYIFLYYKTLSFYFNYILYITSVVAYMSNGTYQPTGFQSQIFHLDGKIIRHRNCYAF